MCLEDPMAIKEFRERSPPPASPLFEINIENGILKMLNVEWNFHLSMLSPLLSAWPHLCHIYIYTMPRQSSISGTGGARDVSGNGLQPG